MYFFGGDLRKHEMIAKCTFFERDLQKYAKNCDCTEKHAKKSWQDRNMVQKNFPQKKFEQGNFEMKEICGNKSLIWSNMKI